MRPARWPAAAALLVAAVGGCAQTGSPPGAVLAERRSDAGDPSLGSGFVHAPLASAFRDEAWVYNGRTGRVISTPHYRIHLTQTEPAFLGRVPMFLEAALTHYRTVATGPDHPLPAPSSARHHTEPMSTFIFRTRDEWERMTRQMLGTGAGPFLLIRRGGYSWGGTAVLFDLDAGRSGGRGEGTRDTMSIAAHEGWHQFTQRTFKQALPTWLEESIATLCEGHAWVGGAQLVEFRPRENDERRGQLAGALTAGRLKSVERLVLETPADLAAEVREEAMDYYAQAWALGLFLKEGAAGRYATGLRACIEDAASGRMATKVVEILGPERAAALAGGTGRLRGLAVLEAYFGREPGGLAELEREYRVFAAELAGSNADRK